MATGRRGFRLSTPHFEEYHASLTDELHAIKNRIRSLFPHWLTDGEWKEAVLRTVMRRHLPNTVTVGRGCIVTEAGHSSQIDILIVDASKPTLFKEGDLMVVTPDAVRAIIEVKTSLDTTRDYERALTKLAEIKGICGHRPWTGLFVYDDTTYRREHQKIFLGLAAAFAHEGRDQHIDCVAAGPGVFSRYWEAAPALNGEEAEHNVWHAYNLPDVAPAYFIGNLVDAISAIDSAESYLAWFPIPGGKELHRSHRMTAGTNLIRGF